MSYPSQTHIVDNFRQIQNILERIATEAGTEGVFLVDESGFLIAEAGDISIDRIALSALLAATFAATEEVARLLGEEGFAELIHQGDKRHLLICKAGQRHIAVSIFGAKTNLGLVKLYVERAVVHLSAILDYKTPERTRLTKSVETNLEGFAEETEDEIEIVTFEKEFEDSKSDTVPEDDVEVSSEADEQTSESSDTDTDDDTITDVLEDIEEEPDMQKDESETSIEDGETELVLESAEDATIEEDNELEEKLEDTDDEIDDDILRLRRDLRSELSQIRVEREQLENEIARVPSDDKQKSEVTDENKGQQKRKDDEGHDVPAWLEE